MHGLQESRRASVGQAQGYLKMAIHKEAFGLQVIKEVFWRLGHEMVDFVF